MKWLKERLKERSTWRGLAILGGVVGFNIDPALVEQIGAGVAASIALSETFIPEQSPVVE